MTYQKLVSLATQIGPPPKPVETLTDLPEHCRLDETSKAKLKDDKQYDVPSLEELIGKDFESKFEILENFPFRGGESVALTRLDQHVTERVKRNLYLE